MRNLRANSTRGFFPPRCCNIFTHIWANPRTQQPQRVELATRNIIKRNFVKLLRSCARTDNDPHRLINYCLSSWSHVARAPRRDVPGYFPEAPVTQITYIAQKKNHLPWDPRDKTPFETIPNRKINNRSVDAANSSPSVPGTAALDVRLPDLNVHRNPN